VKIVVDLPTDILPSDILIFEIFFFTCLCILPYIKSCIPLRESLNL